MKKTVLFLVLFFQLSLSQLISLPFFHQYEVKKSESTTWRNYYDLVTLAEKEDIRFIITSLANKSLPRLYKEKAALESAGDRVDHVHPLRFLSCIFLDEEMKVGIRNLKKRGGWVWSEFLDGLRNSLKEEDQLNNLCDEYVIDFSQNVEIDPNLIFPVIKTKDWKNFIDRLIISIQRKGDIDRYDM